MTTYLEGFETPHGALADARVHLDKAREFLEAAEVNHELELYNAATSNAVTSGINSKDAICLKLTGFTNKADNHDEARAEIRDAGPAGRALVLHHRTPWMW